MSALSNYVTMTITQVSVGVTRAGFGVPMILSSTATFVERLRFYTDIIGVAADFPLTTSAEYRAANAMFAQIPKPVQIAIGRAALKPTLVMQLSAVSPTTNVSYTYGLTVGGKNFAEQAVTFTSDGTPTDAEWATLAAAALNGITGKNFTVTGAASPLTITANTAGDFFYIYVADPSTQTVHYTHTDPGVATDLTNIALSQTGWYALFTIANSKAYGIAAADWVESNNRIYLCESCDTTAITTATGNLELLDQIRANSYKRTAGMYHPHAGQMMCAALFGRCLPLLPGSVTFFGKTLGGVSAFPIHMQPTHRANLNARRAGGYEVVDGTGLSVTFGTSTGDVATGFLDVRRNLDFLQDDMTKAVFGAIVGNDIVPYTDPGIAIIENEVRNSLTRAFRLGILAAPPGKADVTVPTAASIDPTTKASRRLPNIRFTAVTSGAIHSVDIVGQVS
jgi:hypothetical protein